MKDRKNLLKKPNPSLVMMPRIGKLTAVGRKMYNVILKKTHTEVMEIKRMGKVVSGESMFEMPLNDFNQTLSEVGDPKDYRRLVKQYLREMRRIEMDWEAPDADTGVVWSSMGLLSEAQIEVREGIVWVRWMLPPTLLTAVADPIRFTVLDLDLLAKLDSYCAIALYEICSRYKDNPTHLTSRNSTDWWIDALSNTPATVDKKSGLVVRREWRRVKSETLNRAIEEVNAKTDITVDLIEFKVGKAIKEAQFGVLRKQGIPVDLPKIRGDIAELAVRLNVPLDVIAKMVKEGVGDSELKIGLFKLEARMGASGLDPVDNPANWFRRVLNDNTGDAPKYEIVKLAPVVQSLSGSVPVVVVLSLEEQIRQQMKVEFLALNQEAQRPWANIAAENLKEANLLSTSLARRIHDGQWTTGVLLSKAVEAYAVGTYGEDWNMQTGSQMQSESFAAKDY